MDPLQLHSAVLQAGIHMQMQQLLCAFISVKQRVTSFKGIIHPHPKEL